MLRKSVIAVGAIAFLGGVVGLASGAVSPAFMLALWGALIVIFTVYERVIYKPILRAAPDAGFKPTSERFVDDVTGKQVTVYIDPATGERKYVEG